MFTFEGPAVSVSFPTKLRLFSDGMRFNFFQFWWCGGFLMTQRNSKREWRVNIWMNLRTALWQNNSDHDQSSLICAGFLFCIHLEAVYCSLLPSHTFVSLLVLHGGSFLLLLEEAQSDLKTFSPSNIPSWTGNTLISMMPSFVFHKCYLLSSEGREKCQQIFRQFSLWCNLSVCAGEQVGVRSVSSLNTGHPKSAAAESDRYFAKTTTVQNYF